nr:7178_t:CDS:2 [Entrophospora candida]
MNLLKKLTKQNDETEIRDSIPVLVEDITVVPVNEILQVETTPHKIILQIYQRM